MLKRQVVGRVQPRGANRLVAACCDDCSLWVEISGPKGGGAWMLSPEWARALAHHLAIAADMAQGYDGAAPPSRDQPPDHVTSGTAPLHGKGQDRA